MYTSNGFCCSTFCATSFANQVSDRHASGRPKYIAATNPEPLQLRDDVEPSAYCLCMHCVCPRKLVSQSLSEELWQLTPGHLTVSNSKLRGPLQLIRFLYPQPHPVFHLQLGSQREQSSLLQLLSCTCASRDKLLVTPSPKEVRLMRHSSWKV